MQNLRKQAEAVRKAGAKGSPDTVLAHITPEEAAWLKARGGSGRRDIYTGLLHFESEDSDDDSGSQSSYSYTYNPNLNDSHNGDIKSYNDPNGRQGGWGGGSGSSPGSLTSVILPSKSMTIEDVDKGEAEFKRSLQAKIDYENIRDFREEIDKDYEKGLPKKPIDKDKYINLPENEKQEGVTDAVRRGRQITNDGPTAVGAANDYFNGSVDYPDRTKAGLDSARSPIEWVGSLFSGLAPDKKTGEVLSMGKAALGFVPGAGAVNFALDSGPIVLQDPSKENIGRALSDGIGVIAPAAGIDSLATNGLKVVGRAAFGDSEGAARQGSGLAFGMIGGQVAGPIGGAIGNWAGNKIGGQAYNTLNAPNPSGQSSGQSQATASYSNQGGGYSIGGGIGSSITSSSSSSSNSGGTGSLTDVLWPKINSHNSYSSSNIAQAPTTAADMRQFLF